MSLYIFGVACRHLSALQTTLESLIDPMDIIWLSPMVGNVVELLFNSNSAENIQIMLRSAGYTATTQLDPIAIALRMPGLRARKAMVHMLCQRRAAIQRCEDPAAQKWFGQRMVEIAMFLPEHEDVVLEIAVDLGIELETDWADEKLLCGEKRRSC